MWKKYLLVPVGAVTGAFILNTVSETLAERYECRKWYNFLRPSVHCFLIKRASELSDMSLQHWFVFTRKLWSFV